VDTSILEDFQTKYERTSYYDKQKLKGHTHSEALRSLANKWLKIIHCLWMKQLTYDENYRLAQITRRHLETTVINN
jgi:hypothetical protein